MIMFKQGKNDEQKKKNQSLFFLILSGYGKKNKKKGGSLAERKEKLSRELICLFGPPCLALADGAAMTRRLLISYLFSSLYTFIFSIPANTHTTNNLVSFFFFFLSYFHIFAALFLWRPSLERAFPGDYSRPFLSLAIRSFNMTEDILATRHTRQQSDGKSLNMQLINILF